MTSYTETGTCIYLGFLILVSSRAAVDNGWQGYIYGWFLFDLVEVT